MRSQRGIALVFALIMLIVMTLIGIAAFRVSNNQTIMVSNAQHRIEAVNAAEQAIDMVLNSSAFTTNPTAAIATSNCGTGGSNTWCVDTNGNGGSDISVTLTPQPTCIIAAQIPTSQLDLTNARDLACTSGTQQNFGTAGASTSYSMCASSTWEVSAKATDTATGAEVTVVQGVGVRIAATDMTNYCP